MAKGTEQYLRGRKAGVATDQGKRKDMDANVFRTIDESGYCDGGGSEELGKAAKSINAGNRKGGLAGL